MTKDDDIWGALDDALKEEKKETINLKGIPGIKYYLEKGNFNYAVPLMIQILEDPSEYSIPDKIAVTDICKSLVQQGYATYIRLLYPHFYMIHNNTEAYLTRAIPDPVLIFNVSEILTNSKEIMFEEINGLKDTIRQFAMSRKKDYGLNRIPLRDIADSIQINFIIILKLVEEMIQNKEINGHYDSVGDILVLEATEFSCYNCGSEMKKEDKTCANCGTELKTCVICRASIRAPPVQCPKCKVNAHKEHFLEWLKMSADKKTGKGTCPNCQNPLLPSDLKEG
ncbi:MAG: hypothetical protein EAX96_18880 [Candidatus Lokiarchaeota archaeon]|nr:hypothetical protein [Candidatus Lokiarchaeota archaeon]